MVQEPIVVRPLVGEREYALQFELADNAFSDTPSVEGQRRWRERIFNNPAFRGEQLRGAFRGEEQMGGYMLYERMMRMGEARISTGCIGIVVTHPNFRKQGVASALMHDAIDFARANNHHLLLLDGIPDFYYRFGHTDVIDISLVEIDRAAVLAQPGSKYTVREMRQDDAAEILRLYERQYGGFTGSFERTLEEQKHLLSNPNTPAFVTLNDGGEIKGYIAGVDGVMVGEIAADNWDAFSALLQFHARGIRTSEGADVTDVAIKLRYRLPLNSALEEMLIDHLEVPDTSNWQHPAEEWVIRSETVHHRNAGWQGRVVGLAGLMRAIQPELQARWRRALADWRGEIGLAIGSERATIRIDGRDVRIEDGGQDWDVPGALRIAPPVFTQLLFGYRSVAAVLRMTGEQLAGDKRLALDILFPYGHAWITRSDWF
jgi:predicted N-acetyltransferase YhbS